MKFKIGDKVLCMNSDFEKKVPDANFPNGEKQIINLINLINYIN